MARRCHGSSRTYCGYYTFVQMTYSDDHVPYLFSSLDEWIAWDGKSEKGENVLHQAHTGDQVACHRVAAGGAHFVFLATHPHHQVFAAGDNRFGQLGDVALGLDANELHPVDFFSQIEAFPSTIDQVVCGNQHSLVKTEDGDCYIWGWLPGGHVESPTLVELDTDVVAIACGASSSYFLDERGTIFAMGSSTSSSH